MATLSKRTQDVLKQALADPAATAELILHTATGTTGTAITAITVTPTSGTLPTATGTVTIADTATPTVVELLRYCTELKAKVDALRAALTAYGVTA